MGLVTRGILIWLLCASGCSPDRDSHPGEVSSPVPDGQPVVLEVDHQTRWRELRIEGSTDLPDGAVVTYVVSHELGNQLPSNEWPAQNLISDGTAVVQAGQYTARVNTTYWSPGKVEIQVQFPVAPQPDSVRTRYGEFGEYLAGPNVTPLGPTNIASTTHSFDWTR